MTDTGPDKAIEALDRLFALARLYLTTRQWGKNAAAEDYETVRATLDEGLIGALRHVTLCPIESFACTHPLHAYAVSVLNDDGPPRGA